MNRYYRHSRHLCFAGVHIFMLCLLFAQPSPDQPKRQLSRGELRYKLRDGNRWEGVKTKIKHQVADNLKLASLIVREENWRRQSASIPRDSATIFFYAPAANRITVSVFELDKLYYMDPDPKNFGKSRQNSFKWPALLLNALNLPANQLEALAQAKIEDRATFFPIYFQAPDRVRNTLVLEFALIPDKDMAFDLMLLAGDSDQPIHTWTNIIAKRYEFKLFIWPLDAGRLATHKNLSLLALEKNKTANQNLTRRHVFPLHFAQ